MQEVKRTDKLTDEARISICERVDELIRSINKKKGVSTS